MNASPKDKSASEEVDAIIKKFSDWRGEKLAHIRSLIKQADPGGTEEVKWKTPSNPDGIPVWAHDGIICTGETYKNHLRLGFAKGPLLKDPKGLINSYRAIIIHEEDKINETAFKELIDAAIELNHKNKKKAS
jgi:hypothetical protein